MSVENRKLFEANIVDGHSSWRRTVEAGRHHVHNIVDCFASLSLLQVLSKAVESFVSEGVNVENVCVLVGSARQEVGAVLVYAWVRVCEQQCRCVGQNEVGQLIGVFIRQTTFRDDILCVIL